VDIQEYISSGIVEAFVLGLASEQEVQEVLRFRKEFPELDAAILSFELSLEKQGAEAAIAPPSRVKDNLFLELEASFSDNSPTVVSSINPVSEVSEEPFMHAVKSVQGISPWWRYAAAAVFVAFLANAALSIWLYSKYTNLGKEYATLKRENAQEKLRFNSLYADVFRMQDTKMQMIKMEGVEGKEGNLATVYWDKESGEVYLFKNKLAEISKDKQYQLWAIVDGKPVDAGVIDPDCEAFCKLKNIQNPQAFAITLEKAGGSPTPTLEEMYVMGGI
jgi:anti-sigma-K factor RskA